MCIALVVGFVVTGFASSAYHRKRANLGTEHYESGRRLEAQGKVEQAVDEYRTALFFSPDKTEYRVSLATALVEAGRLDEAESHLEQLLQEDPTNGRINLLLGRVAVKRGKLKQAIEYYQRGVYEYWPESQLFRRREARWELASLLSKTGERTQFVGELMQLYTNLPPGDTGQKLRVGSLLLANGATSEASRIFQDVLKQQPQNVDALRGMGGAYFNLGDFVSARHQFQKALRLDAKDKESAQRLALTNDVIDMDAALPYITSAEQLRRNKNLLARVIKDLDACFRVGAGAGDPRHQRLDQARQLLGQRVKGEDAALAMQRTAARLWADKGAFCGAAAPQDRALDTVFARIGNE